MAPAHTPGKEIKMTDRRWFFILIGLTLGITFAAIPPAEAQIKWRGFSELCFDATFKGGPLQDGDLQINLINVQVQTRCDNLANPAETCQPGGGNAGDITVVFPAQSSDPTKTNGIITSSGCISLDKYDHHLAVDHQHTCNPLTNVNKVEIAGSAFVPAINTTWVLTNTSPSGKVTVLKSGNQTCEWPGTFNETLCKPNPDGDEITFVCPIDVINKKP
jgi:hypothetical protein